MWLGNHLIGNTGTVKKMKAKHGHKIGSVRSDWGRIIVDAMKFCLVQKYAQSAVFREELERSKGLFIVEDQTTFQNKTANTWGEKLTPDGKGKPPIKDDLFI